MPVVAVSVLMITACTNNWGVNQVSKRASTSDLAELVNNYHLLENEGVGAYYKLIGQMRQI